MAPGTNPDLAAPNPCHSQMPLSLLSFHCLFLFSFPPHQDLTTQSFQSFFAIALSHYKLLSFFTDIAFAESTFAHFTCSYRFTIYVQTNSTGKEQSHSLHHWKNGRSIDCLGIASSADSYNFQVHLHSIFQHAIHYPLRGLLRGFGLRKQLQPCPALPPPTWIERLIRRCWPIYYLDRLRYLSSHHHQLRCLDHRLPSSCL